MKLLIGLGNPGKKYERTRHNVGFVVIDQLITDYGLTTTVDTARQAEVAKGEVEKKRIVVAKPQTYMNNSGESVQALLHFYKLTPQDLIVIHDDKDIALGEIRIQKDRGAAGHNGVQSIIDRLGTKDFLRIRVGVAPNPLLNEKGLAAGLPNAIGDTADFVLGKFTQEEQKYLKDVIERVVTELKNHI